MPRYFLEIAYRGTDFSGFQTQKNAHTVQQEIENAFSIIQKTRIILTGSSRTDAGVHALQNYFHFDHGEKLNPELLYNMNAVLPGDIAVKSITEVPVTAHCRFDAISREYKYYIYQKKDPFLKDRAYYFPFKLDFRQMQEAAAVIKEYSDFTSFSKRNTQVKNFICSIMESRWVENDNCLIYNVIANRFLRGMVRALTSTMLKVGRHKISIEEFRSIIESRNCANASFAVPPQGLFLVQVRYPDNHPVMK